MPDKNLDIYDYKKFFHEECEPLWAKLKSIMLIHGIPCYFSACIKNDTSSSEYYSDGVMTGSEDIHLTEDLISKHLLLNNGFDVVSQKDEIEDYVFSIFENM